MLAYSCRIFHNVNPNTISNKGSLLVSELKIATIYCVRIVQAQYYSKEISSLTSNKALPPKSSLHSLHPLIHEDGTLRVGGRLENSQLPFEAKHQFIIPASHCLTTLIISDANMKTMHGGAQLTIATVRENFWIPAIKRKVKTVIYSCVICFRQRAKFSQQLMGQLPAPRVQPAFAFMNVGVDYAGPITIKYGNPRSKITTKTYFALFICMATRAIHMEIVSSLSTEAFMSAFNRFVSR